MRLYVFDDFRVGVVSDGGDEIADVSGLLGAHLSPQDRMGALIADWPRLGERVVAAAAEPGPRAALGEVTVRAPQPRPSKIVAAPVNYVLHQQEMGGEHGVYRGETIKTIETYAGFVKAPSSIVGPDAPIRLPDGERRVDHEAELGVVIGRRAHRVGRDRALEHVFGYVPLLDITIRGDEDRSFRKSFDTFTPIGPAIVTADAVADPGALDFELHVNDELRQRANTRDLIYDVARLIELYSDAMTLEPGDIIATGTPEGVGPITASDVVRLQIDTVGELVMDVVGPDADGP